MRKPKFRFGDLVRERFSGFEGGVVSVTWWNNGCLRYGVRASRLHEGKSVDEYFDEEDLELVKAASAGEGAPRGGSRPAPKRAADCPRG